MRTQSLTPIAATLSWRTDDKSTSGSDILLSRVTVSSNEDGAWIRIRLTNREIGFMMASSEFGAVLNVARASGGYSFNRTLSENDDQLLMAAVRHCV